MSQVVSAMVSKRHELYEDIQAHIKSVLVDSGIESGVADQVAVSVINHLADHWGGSTFSFPKDSQHKIAQRDRDIYAKFRGTNHRALAKEYGLTENGIYRIVKRMQQQYIQEKQPDIFE